ncbi:hypothetical protein [Cognaticolwellia beringensis]|uniref:hypothetical protein n=1 Tax=Cognaticolwellia beringensis TaxID=1967665 RepID=UPI0012F9475A|nr:hypothetical protein [Cognaticolwellia beringensis]
MFIINNPLWRIPDFWVWISRICLAITLLDIIGLQQASLHFPRDKHSFIFSSGVARLNDWLMHLNFALGACITL